MDEDRSATGELDSLADGAPEAAAGHIPAGEAPAGEAPAGEAPAGEVAREPEPEGSIGIVGHLQNAAEPIANAVEPFMDHVVGPVAGAIGSMIEAAGQAWSGQESAIGRWLRGISSEPIANLYELFPEARQASPHELGMRFVPIEDIRGTAVAGAAQRGGDFLPLRPFRGENWEGRWRRIGEAHERMKPLPPGDLIKFNDEYWVVDGHNRVAAALYNRGVGLDAMVIELVPLDGRVSERPRNLLSYLGETGELRAAVQGRRPAMGMRRVETNSTDEASIMYEPDLATDPTSTSSTGADDDSDAGR
jgi:hypothetical protein